MNAVQTSRDIVLEPADNDRLANLCGQFDEHLRQIERRLDVEIASRGNRFRITGKPGAAEAGGNVLQSLFEMTDKERLDPERVHILLQESQMDEPEPDAANDEEITIQTRRKLIRPRGANQLKYLKAIRDNDLAFGVGPAGTGKTYLAVAFAASYLERGLVERLILSRPAVEAGERLGFLPGDMRDKVDPYLRPLYDALYDVLPPEKVERGLETGIIEIAPLAFMRGRTLADSFVILDEAQNCTSMQMKMFLTRMGQESRIVVSISI